MPITGVDAVTFGVDDFAEPARFLDDWGLTPVTRTGDRLAYRTIDGTQVFVRPIAAPDLPPAIEPGNTVREVIWGLSDPHGVRGAGGKARHRGRR